MHVEAHLGHYLRMVPTVRDQYIRSVPPPIVLIFEGPDVQGLPQ